MRLFLLRDTRITVHACDARTPLRLACDGAPVDDATWVASLVTYAPSARAPERHALIARPGACVTLGPDRLAAGVADVGDGDHVFVGGAEAILDGDALPAPVEGDGADEPCPACCTRPGGDGRPQLLACPVCGGRACDACWSSAPGGTCLTTGCTQPAARDRALAAPRPGDFASWPGDDGAGVEAP